MQPRYLCACVSFIICLFIGSGIYSLSFFIFPLDARFDSRWELRSPLADLSSWPYQNIKPAFSERLSCLPFWRLASLSSSRPDLPFVRKTFGRITCPFCSFLAISPWIFPLWKLLFLIWAPILLKLHILAHLIKSFPTECGLCSCIKKNVDPSSRKEVRVL